MNTRLKRSALCAAAATVALAASAGEVPGENTPEVTTQGFGAFVPTPARPEDEAKPAHSPKTSLVDAAPVLLPYMNNAPVFGIPGTIGGGFWDRTQVTGDWGGERTALARRGFFLDMYTTTAYQNVNAGGVKTGDASWTNNQFSINVDTGRAGWWPGGVLHMNVQSRYGSPPQDTFTVGTYVPQYYGLLLPGPLEHNNTYASDYYIAQAFSPKLSVIAGKISGLFLPDHSLIADTYRYAFTNFNFNKNPFFANFFGPTAWAVLGAWRPAEKWVITGGALDPDSKPDNFAKDAFDRVNLYLQANHAHVIGGLPGQVYVGGNWSNKPKIDLDSPFGPLPRTRVPEALGVLLGVSEAGDLPINYKGESWFAIGGFTQMLWSVDGGAVLRERLKSGQPPRGVSMIGRVGYSPEQTNTVDRHASLALHAYGVSDARRYDSFGIGFYDNHISSDLKASIRQLTANQVDVKDERGIEAFYDYALTPAIKLVLSYQRIWNPLVAQVASRKDSADVFLARVNVAW